MVSKERATSASSLENLISSTRRLRKTSKLWCSEVSTLARLRSNLPALSLVVPRLFLPVFPLIIIQKHEESLPTLLPPSDYRLKHSRYASYRLPQNLPLKPPNGQPLRGDG